MVKFVIKRVLLMIPVLIGIVFIVFTILSLTPGNPARNILGPTADQALVDALNAELGYDKPFFERFFSYIYNIVTDLDFGISYATQKPIADAIAQKFPYTFIIATFAVAVTSVIGVSLGILSAVKQYSVIDSTVTVAALCFAVIPAFWTGMMLQLLFSIKLDLLPTMGAETAASYILPVLTIAISATGSLIRLTRSLMLETIRQDYIRTARAKGAPEKVVIFKHALKNTLLPIITNIGTLYGGMLGGTVLTETVFNIPGIGSYIITSIRSKDIPAVMTCVLLISAMFCIIMLIVDLLYAFIDPRLKAKYAKR